MEAENLFYTCCERIDQDVEVAEPFLVGCITYIIRDRGERGIRQKVKDDLCMNNYEPYLRELRLIASMHDDSIQALVTSSLDLSVILKQVEIVYTHAIDADFSKVQPSTHANKARRASDMLMELSKLMKPTTKKVNADMTLFSEGMAWQD